MFLSLCTYLYTKAYLTYIQSPSIKACLCIFFSIVHVSHLYLHLCILNFCKMPHKPQKCTSQGEMYLLSQWTPLSLLSSYNCWNSLFCHVCKSAVLLSCFMHDHHTMFCLMGHLFRRFDLDHNPKAYTGTLQ